MRPFLESLLWEADGDFNPGWAIFIAAFAFGAFVSFALGVAVLREPKSWPAGVAVLAFLVSVMLIAAVIVVPIARAKLLAPHIGAAVKGIRAPAIPDTPADRETLVDRSED
jgi:hypothetical protein